MPSHKPTFGSLNVPRKTVSDRFGHFVVFWIFCRLLDILSFIGYFVVYWIFSRLLDILSFIGYFVVCWIFCRLLDTKKNHDKTLQID